MTQVWSEDGEKKDLW